MAAVAPPEEHDTVRAGVPPVGDLQAALARTAYAMGWARSGGPMTDRVRAGSIAAVSLALEHAGRPGVVEATAALGHREGVDALVNGRRDDLEAATLAAVLAGWHDLVAATARDRLARGLARRMGLTAVDSEPDTGGDAEPDDGEDGEPDSGGPAEDKPDREDLAAVVLAALQNAGSANPTAWDKLRDAVLTAIRSSRGEGHAGALAVAAHRVFPQRRFDAAAAAAAATAAVGRGADLNDADAAVQAMLAAAAGEIGRKLAGLRELNYRTVLDALNAGLDEPEPRAVKVTAGLVNGRSIIRGLLGLFAGAGIRKVNMITEAGACPVCLDLAAQGPFRLAEAPDLPIHPWCRCSLEPVGGRGGGLLQLARAFLT